MYEGRLAVAIFSFDRPQYLLRLVESLKAQREPSNLDIHVFQDGAVNRFSGRKAGDPNRIAACVDLIMHHFPGTEIHRRKDNVSIAIQQYEAYEELHREYPFLVCLDDDVELGPDWMRIARIFVDELEKDPRLFRASPGFKKAGSLIEPDPALDAYRTSLIDVPWIGYVMDCSKWPAIRKVFQPYYDIVKGIDYRTRPHAEIQALFRSRGWHMPQSSQDGAKNMALHVLGLTSAKTILNRGRYIGEIGEHMTPTAYVQMGWKKHWQIEWPGDTTRMSLRRIG